MNAATLRLVLLVSCAHALVHVYELSLPSVEQKIAREFHPQSESAGKSMTGLLSNVWRLPWGLGALLAGWLVDQFGARRMLAIYLLGCSATCAATGYLSGISPLFAAMFGMGVFASIYHPAGLALISHETDGRARLSALGVHGIFGSAGIGLAPLVVGGFLSVGVTWREYYWLLTVPGLLLGLLLLWPAVTATAYSEAAREASQAGVPHSHGDDGERSDWPSFFTLTCLAVLQGFTYSALMSFLPRYLSHWQPSWLPIPESGLGGYLAGGVLLIGCFGQYAGARFARPERLEFQLTIVTFLAVPCLAWMAVAQGGWCAAAAGMWALVHFMHQPIYNGLIAKYTSRRRRSLCYGFSFAMGLGIGSLGASFAGLTSSQELTYGVLAAVAAGAGLLGTALTLAHHARIENQGSGAV